jgi:N-acetylglutamate synthase-like GNAT family acetyltransferase
MPVKSADGIRPLAEADLDRLVVIDKAYVGHNRRRFFERRFAAAKGQPSDYLLIGIGTGGKLLGFGIAHIRRGEFGQKDAVAVLDALGVDPEHRERGLGHSLVKELLSQARKLGVRTLQSEADWRDHHLLNFFDEAGFDLAPRLTLVRPVGELREAPGEEV